MYMPEMLGCALHGQPKEGALSILKNHHTTLKPNTTIYHPRFCQAQVVEGLYEVQPTLLEEGLCGGSYRVVFRECRLYLLLRA